MLTFPLKPIHGEALTAELAAAGIAAEVTIVNGRIEVATDAPESKVRPVVDAHVPPPSPADPDVEFRKSLEGATTVAQIRDALLGKAGPGAQARTRR